MLKIDDIVVYGSNGVCRVTEIKDEIFSGEVKKYFVLKPVYDNKNTFFVPSFNEMLMSKIRPVMSHDEATALINKMRDIPPNWIDNDKTRFDIYKKILDGAVCEEIVAVAKAIYERKATLTEKGKKLRNTDDMVMRTAEALIETECAWALGITRSDVAQMCRAI